MSNKRRFDMAFCDDDVKKVEVAKKHNVKKHSLDSDEEDSGAEEEKQNVMPVDDIEGEEEGIAGMEGEVKITPFNMKEELEEGHFDTQGHYHFKKDSEIKDSWLDNIDWVKVQGRPEDKYKVHKDDDLKGLGDDSSSDSDSEAAQSFNLITSYKEMLAFMKPKETVLKTLQRLGANAKISSAERWKRKKAGIVDTGAQDVTKLTSIANEILTRTGNMDIYQETFEKITSITEKSKMSAGGTSKEGAGELDMYADDFDTKEKDKKHDTGDASNNSKDNDSKNGEVKKELMWEFKWTQTEDSEVHGPHSTGQMQQWVDEGFFKTGVWVRKCGQEGPFYTSNRIDFELYL